MISGPDGIPPDQLIGPENDERLIGRVQHMYRQFMAQVVGDPGSVRLTSTNTTTQDDRVVQIASRLDARIHDVTGALRVVPRSLSKILLQAVLDTLVVLLLVVLKTWRLLAA